MKIITEASKFTNTIKWVGLGLDRKTNGTRIILDAHSDGRCYLSYHSGSVYTSAPLEVLTIDFQDENPSQDSVQVALDGVFLQRLAQGLPKTGDITLISRRDEPMKVTSKTGRFTAPTYNARKKPTPNTSCVGEVDAAEFFSTISRAARVCDNRENIRHKFVNTVDLSLNPDTGTIRVFSFDTYVMAETTMRYTPTGQPQNQGYVLIPSQYASMIRPGKDMTGAVKILEEIGANGKTYRVGFEFDDGRRILMPLKDVLRCPNVDAMVEECRRGVQAQVIVSTAAVTSAIKNVSALTANKTDISVTGQGDTLTVSCDDNSITVPLTGGSFEITIDALFSREVIAKGLSPITTKDVQVSFSTDAVILEPIGASIDTTVIFTMKRYRGES